MKDFAVHGDYFYILVKNFNLITDAIFVIRKKTGRVETIWGIGRHNAEAIGCDGQTLWIISRSERYFIRKLNLAGKGIGDIGIASIPEGVIHGVACSAGGVVFTVRDNAESRLYSFNPKNHAISKIATFSGTVNAVTCFQGVLMVQISEFDTYADSWLLVMGPDGSVKKKMHFVKEVPVSLAADGKKILHDGAEGFRFYRDTVRSTDG